MGPPSDSHVLWAARPSSLPLPTGYAARCAGCGSGVATSPRARAASRAMRGSVGSVHPLQRPVSRTAAFNSLSTL